MIYLGQNDKMSPSKVYNVLVIFEDTQKVKKFQNYIQYASGLA